MPKVVYTPNKGLYQQSGTNVGSAMMAFVPDVAPQTLSAAGPVSPLCYFTAITTDAAAVELTLAAGSVVGQLKKIMLAVVQTGGNAANLTIENCVGDLDGVFAFDKVGDVLELMWNGTAWRVIASYNNVDGSGGPA